MSEMQSFDIGLCYRLRGFAARARVRDPSPQPAFFGLGQGLLLWSAVACWVKVYLYRAAQLKGGRRAAAGAVSQKAYCKMNQRRGREVVGVGVIRHVKKWIDREEMNGRKTGFGFTAFLNLHCAFFFTLW